MKIFRKMLGVDPGTYCRSGQKTRGMTSAPWMRSGRQSGEVSGEAILIALTIILVILTLLLVPEARCFLRLSNECAAAKTQQRAVNGASYRLGKVVSWLCYYETNKERFSPSDLEDLHRVVEERHAEIAQTLKELGISINLEQVDVVSPAHQYSMSPAGLYLEGVVRSKHGEEAEKAYRLGADLQDAIWKAVHKQYTVGPLMGSASVALKILNDDAGHFGVKPVDRGNVENAFPAAEANEELEHQLNKLDSRIRDVL